MAEFTAFSYLFGGIGLLILAIQLMTRSIRKAAGSSLKATLRRATDSRIRALFSGMLVTGLLQSSNAVTVTTIGFVNAGLLSLSRSVNFLCGCAIGATMTTWLLASTALDFNLSALALPLAGVGMLLSLSSRNERLGQTGKALAALGLFFLSLQFLKQGTMELTLFPQLSDSGQYYTMAMVLTGIFLTVLMQSATATIAIIMALLASGGVALSDAILIMAGAQLGTSSTILLTATGTTSNARRAAIAHLVINCLTTLIVVVMTLLISSARINELTSSSAFILAAAHTCANIAAVILLWPLTEPLVAKLEKLYSGYDKDLGHPRYLDSTLTKTPDLALEAIAKELGYIDGLCHQMARMAISSEKIHNGEMNKQLHSVNRLVNKLGKFNQQLAKHGLDEETCDILPVTIRLGRYMNEVARLSTLLPNYYDKLTQLRDPDIQLAVYHFQRDSIRLLDACEIDARKDTSSREASVSMERLEREYQQLKNQILEATVSGRLKSRESVDLLDALSHIHRLGEQAAKISRYWVGIMTIQHRTPLKPAC